MAKKPKLPWCVLNMDQGLIRREATRAAAVKWCGRQYDGQVLERHCYGPGAYAYTFGYPNGNSSEFLSIEREDVARAQGWGDVLGSVAMYPHVDDPHQQREGRSTDEQGS